MAMKVLAMSAIVLVAVIMGMSAVAPVILQQAEAHGNQPLLSPEICDRLKDIPHPSPGISHLLTKHCPI